MADEQKPIPTAPIIPPVVDTGIMNNVPTVSGTERLTVIPEIKLQPELKGIVTIEDQPENQIESPIPATEKIVEINRVPSSSVQVTLQTQPKTTGELEPKLDNQKVIPIDEARRRAAKKTAPVPRLIKADIEEMDSPDALGHLEVKVDEWKKEKAA